MRSTLQPHHDHPLGKRPLETVSNMYLELLLFTHMLFSMCFRMLYMLSTQQG